MSINAVEGRIDLISFLFLSPSAIRKGVANRKTQYEELNAAALAANRYKMVGPTTPHAGAATRSSSAGL